jgi:signal peptidase I
MPHLVQCPAGFRYDPAIHGACPCPSCWADRSSDKLSASLQVRPFDTAVKAIQNPPNIDRRGSDYSGGAPRSRGVLGRIIGNAHILVVVVFAAYFFGVYFGYTLNIHIALATLLIIAIFLLAWWVVARRILRAKNGIPPSKLQKVAIVAAALLISMIWRTLLIQPFNINGGSMLPTLFAGDYVLVAKFRYGFTHYSLPFSPPIFSGRVFGSQPGRGDVVVFRAPKNNAIDHIGRVVGLAADRIQMIRGMLYINGMPAKREGLDDVVLEDKGRMQRVKRDRETLPNGASYETLDLIANGLYDDTPVYTVPSGHCFILGDNRDNSSDSRMLADIGYVPLENIIGPIRIVLWPNVRHPAVWRSWFI